MATSANKKVVVEVNEASLNILDAFLNLIKFFED